MTKVGVPLGYLIYMTWDDINAAMNQDATVSSYHTGATIAYVMWCE
jgi:hypothetical protein